MDRIIFHIDVNNAFLSWHAVYLLKNGYKQDIRNINAIIAGDSKTRNGIVLAKSMIAKKNGVKTAETIMIANKKSPGLTVFPPLMTIYYAESHKLFSLLSKYFDYIEVASVDECYIDYTHFKSIYGDEIKFAYKLKDEIFNCFGWTVNIGIGNNKLCAKMASDLEKPNKVHTIYQEKIREKMWSLPVGDLYMTGKKAVEKLKLLKINTIGDLANSNVEILIKLFKSHGLSMHKFANGIDDSLVERKVPLKEEISISRTTPEDILTKKDGLNFLKKLNNQLLIRLKSEEKYTSLIGINFKTSNFKVYSKQLSINNYLNDEGEIFKIVSKLFNELYNDEPIRNLGIRFGNFSTKKIVQRSIFDGLIEEKKDNKLDEIEKKLQSLYGEKVVYIPKDGKEFN